MYMNKKKNDLNHFFGILTEEEGAAILKDLTKIRKKEIKLSKKKLLRERLNEFEENVDQGKVFTRIDLGF